MEREVEQMALQGAQAGARYASGRGRTGFILVLILAFCRLVVHLSASQMRHGGRTLWVRQLSFALDLLFCDLFSGLVGA